MYNCLDRNIINFIDRLMILPEEMIKNAIPPRNTAGAQQAATVRGA